METKVREFRSIADFSEYVRDQKLDLRVLSKQGRMSVVGAYNQRDELIARVMGYSPKGGR